MLDTASGHLKEEYLQGFKVLKNSFGKPQHRPDDTNKEQRAHRRGRDFIEREKVRLEIG